MIEKRFWFVIDKGKLDYVQDNVTGEKITVTELEDLLNELYEENKRLSHKANFWHKKYRIVKTTIMRDDDL